jgi:hypothetical protein
VGTNRDACSANDPVNKLDPGGNEYYENENSWNKDEVNTLRSLFDSLRNFFSSERSNTKSIIDKWNNRGSSGSISLTRAELATYTNIQRSYGPDITGGILERHLGRLDEHLSETGTSGTGAKIVRGGVGPDPNALAAAAPDSNTITIYDAFFTRKEAEQLYTLAHEGGHAHLGLTDEIPIDAGRRFAAAGPYDVQYQGYMRYYAGYRGPGRDIASPEMWNIPDHNDSYICATGIHPC